MFLAAFIVVALLYFGLRKTSPVPSKFGAAIESLVSFVRNDVAIGIIGPEGVKYFPYLLSMINNSFMSRRNTIVVPGGKMGFAMEVILGEWSTTNFAGSCVPRVTDSRAPIFSRFISASLKTSARRLRCWRASFFAVVARYVGVQTLAGRLARS